MKRIPADPAGSDRYLIGQTYTLAHHDAPPIKGIIAFKGPKVLVAVLRNGRSNSLYARVSLG